MFRIPTVARWASCLFMAAALLLSPACGGGSSNTGGGGIGQTEATTPTFTTQPSSQTVSETGSVTFTALATGNGMITYQWKKDGVDLAGKTGASLTLNPIVLADAGSYTVVATNTLGTSTRTATSNAAVLTVNAVATTPTFTTQPISETVSESGIVTFTALATGNGTITYQWKKDGVDLVGKTGASLVLNPVALADAGSYTVVATNALGTSTRTATSNAAVLTVNAVATTPTFTTHPSSQSASESGSVTFTALATGNGTITYQWKKDGVDLAGKTGASLVLNPVALTDAGSYTVVATNTLNGTTRTATSNAAVLTVNAAASTPTFTTHPISETVSEGGSVTFTALATGNGTITYQWKKDGVDLAGKTGASLVLNSVALTDAGSYTVVATNTLNGTTRTATSNAAVLTVNTVATTPTFTTHPSTQSVSESGSVTFTALATGNGTITYQWKKDGVDLAGKIGASLVLNSVALTDAGSYTVVATNTLNGTTRTATSNAAVLTVTPASGALTIHTQPQSKTVTVPDGATFSVSATGTGTLTYQWRKNGTSLAGETASTYTLSATDLRETSAQFSVVVTDANTSTTSENATLTVMAPNPTYAGDPTYTTALEVFPNITPNPAAPNGIFRFGFHDGLRNPLWTSYANFRFMAPFSIGSGRDYEADTRLTNPVQTSDFYFATSGMTRGHMVMRSDVGFHYGQQAADDSNYMSNMSPQLESLNGLIWQDLEGAVGGSNGTPWNPGLADTFGRIWIYTGPVFVGTPARITTSNVAIPTAFYKIVVREKAPGVAQAVAMLIPHQPVPPRGDLWKYVSSVARVEALTGLNFFPTLPDTAPADLKTDVDVRGWGTPYEASGKPSVHMIEPSWNDTAVIGATRTFVGQATSSNSSVASVSWNFGDGATATAQSASHAYAANGTYTVQFTATDALGATNTITRVITVTGGNSAPVMSTIGNQSTMQDTIKSVNFTVSDDSTAAGSIIVTAASNNQTLLPDASVVVVNSNGTCTLTMTPATGLTGTARITVTARDGDTATSVQSFDLTVSTSGGGGQPILIISQYYDNGSPNRWVEITNIGTATYDAAGTVKYYLGLNSNPFSTNGFSALYAVPTLAPGASTLVVNALTATPAASAITGTPVLNSTVTSFNGDDILYLTTNNTPGVTTSWAARTDVLGINDASWTGTSTSTANTTAAAGYRTSWVRKATTVVANATFTLAEWDKVTTATVDGALTGDTNRLGEHTYNH